MGCTAHKQKMAISRQRKQITPMLEQNEFKKNNNEKITTMIENHLNAVNMYRSCPTLMRR